MLPTANGGTIELLYMQVSGHYYVVVVRTFWCIIISDLFKFVDDIALCANDIGACS